MAKASDILRIAEGWVGCNEADGSFKKIIDKYNSYTPRARNYVLKYSDEWCDGFVSAVAIEADAVDLIGTEVGVEKHVQIFKEKGIWIEDGKTVPEPADVIIFNWDDATQPNDGAGDHIGYVKSANGSIIIAVEGNMTGEKVGYRTIPNGWGYIRGFARPKYDQETPKDEPKTNDDNVDIIYQVKTQHHGWLGQIKNYDLNDNVNGYAGWENSPIIGVAMKVNKGKIKYRVHVKGGGWLGWIEKFDLNDYHNGYAGNNKPIDAIQIYYYTPDGMNLKEAVYKVNEYGWQHDTDTNNGMDGYAGVFGKTMTKLRVSIKDCD